VFLKWVTWRRSNTPEGENGAIKRRRSAADCSSCAQSWPADIHHHHRHLPHQLRTLVRRRDHPASSWRRPWPWCDSTARRRSLVESGTAGAGSAASRSRRRSPECQIYTSRRQIRLEKLSSIEDWGNIDRVTALLRPYALDIDLWSWPMTLTFNHRRAMVVTNTEREAACREKIRHPWWSTLTTALS